MCRYDHRVHAGNAGDVWKHFILLEAACYLLIPESDLVYAESHSGRPEYTLCTPGDWEGGIGKFWPLLPSLSSFFYFSAISDFNPSSLRRYPGSTCLIQHCAKKIRKRLRAEIWDIDDDVAVEWQQRPGVIFHKSDGFNGVNILLNNSCAGLLFIDPPYLDDYDDLRSIRLLCLAEEKKWTALCWHPIESDLGIDSFLEAGFKAQTLYFEEAGLEAGSMIGSAVLFVSPDENIGTYLDKRKVELLRAIRSD